MNQISSLSLMTATVSLSSCSNRRLHTPADGQSQQDAAGLPGCHPEVGGTAACRSRGCAPRHFPVSAVHHCCSLSICEIQPVPANWSWAGGGASRSLSFVANGSKRAAISHNYHLERQNKADKCCGLVQSVYVCMCICVCVCLC